METRQLTAGDDAPPCMKTPRKSHGNRGAIESKNLDLPSYTFIDHDDNLSSKRIKDINARKAIRSHVMRDVRRRERIAGHKRVSKRENPGESDASEVSKSTARSNRGQRSFLIKSEPERPHHVKGALTADSNLHKARYLDPFDTLPGVSEIPSLADMLLRYYVSVFIPMTFPTESIFFRDTNATMHTSVNDSLTDAGNFYGLLTVAAAHKNAISRRHSRLIKPSPNNHQNLFDSDYGVIKGKCIRILNEKLSDPSQALGQIAIQSVIHLITSSLILGHYGDAQIHLTGLKQMVGLCGGLTSQKIRSSSLIHAIIWSDHKIATGLMAQPIFHLPWKPAPLTSDLIQRIQPSPSSQLSYLGCAFWNEDPRAFSQSLICVVQKLQDTLLVQNFIMEQDQQKKPYTRNYIHQLYLLIIEVEHELLSYPFQIPATGHGNSHAANLDPKEAMTRMGCICLFNSVIIVTHPAAGMGRSLTKFMKKTIRTFIDLYPLIHLTTNDLNLLSWVLFIGAQGSLEQMEHPWFVSNLAEVIKLRNWSGWTDVVGVLQQYIYIPRVQEVTWRFIWEEAISHINPKK